MRYLLHIGSSRLGQPADSSGWAMRFPMVFWSLSSDVRRCVFKKAEPRAGHGLTLAARQRIVQRLQRAEASVGGSASTAFRTENNV